MTNEAKPKACTYCTEDDYCPLHDEWFDDTDDVEQATRLHKAVDSWNELHNEAKQDFLAFLKGKEIHFLKEHCVTFSALTRVTELLEAASAMDKGE